MPPVYSVLSTENPLFTSYLFYASILGLKVLFMAPLTAQQRIKKKASIFLVVPIFHLKLII